MKLVGLVFLGILASIAFGIGILYLLSWFSNPSGSPRTGSSNDGVGMQVFLYGVCPILIPIAFFFGSIITGYFIYNEVESKWSLILLAPALCCSLLWLALFGLQFVIDALNSFNPKIQKPPLVLSFLVSFGIPILWYFASLGGTFFGYYLRGRIVKWWHNN
jgi:hypothetical protein